MMEGLLMTAMKIWNMVKSMKRLLIPGIKELLVLMQIRIKLELRSEKVKMRTSRSRLTVRFLRSYRVMAIHKMLYLII